MEYEIKEFQTGLDVVSQLFGNQDNIGTLMLNNEDFDINKMQQDLKLNYTKPENDKTINEITNNNYIFINRQNIVYNLLETINFDKGYHSLTQYTQYYGRCYVVNNSNNDTFYLNSDDDKLVIYEDGTAVSIFIEEYNSF